MRFIIATLLVGSVFFQVACNKQETAAATETAATPAKSSTEAGLYNVSKDQLAHLKVEPAGSVTWSVSISTTGTVDWDADRTTQSISQVNGPISRILVDTGAHVKEGEPLLYVLSPDVANAISTYRKARNREVYNKRIVDRTKEMLDHGAVAQKDFESAEADYNDATTDVQNTLQSLKIFGHTKDDIDAAEQQGKAISPELALRSPITGTVVQKLVSPGQVIQAGTSICFLISNVSTVWVQGHIFDRDLPNVRMGDAVEESNPASGKTFHGTIAYIGSFVDPTTRTTPVRIVTSNPEGLLKKDMFMNAVIHTSTRQNIIAVPVSAILHDAQNEPIVYVEAEPGKFGQRSVQVGAQQNGQVEITKGLKAGERIVTEGSLFLQFANTNQ